jgi:CRISPR-associated endoribonuclease Cas6
MRFKLLLSVNSQYNILPLNYQYELSSWIYHIIYHGDHKFSEWLHNRGYELDYKRFKLFTFSNLFIQKPYKLINDRIKIISGKASFQVSFYIEEAVGHFLAGLFQEQRFTIGDQKSKAEFTTQQIELLPEPLFTYETTFRCLSPICLSRKGELSRHPEYLSPHVPDYSQYFFNNLLSKYIAVNPQPQYCLEDLKTEILNQQPLTLQILSKPKEKLIKIKADTQQQSFIKGYVYRFKITGPPELIALGYYTGFGEKNSLGFGCVDLDQKDKS